MLDLDRRILGPDHRQTLAAMNNLGLAVQSQGRLAEAEQLLREALATEERVYGPEHQDTVNNMENLADLLADEGHLADAEKLHRQALADCFANPWTRTPADIVGQIRLG